MKRNISGKIKRWQKLLFGAICVIVFFGIAVNFVKNWFTNRQIDSEIVGMREQVNSLEQENLEFRQLIDYFNSTAYVEERARIDLGLKKPGEKVIVVPDGLTTTTTASDSSDAEAGRSNFWKWVDYLFR